jgi:hypothetical protein
MCRPEPEEQGSRQCRVYLLSTLGTIYMVVQKMPALMMAESVALIINLRLMPIVHLRGRKARPGVHVLLFVFVVK